MSVFYGKVVELQAIEMHDGVPCIRVRLTATEPLELTWAIDDTTAAGLLSVAEFDGIHKYRLSRHAAWDADREQMIGYVTKTRRDQSERYPFACSEAFIHNLNTVQELQHKEQWKEHPFLSLACLEPMAEPEWWPERPELFEPPLQMPAAKPSLIRGIPGGRRNRPRKWIATATIGMLSILLLGSFDAPRAPVLEAPEAPSFMAKAAAPAATVAEAATHSPVPVHAAAAAAAAEHAEAEHTEAATGSRRPADPKDTLEREAKPHANSDAQPQAKVPYIQLKEPVIFSLPKGYVALTFDDGPSKYSVEIMKVLQEHRVGGTFFFVGTNVVKHPDEVKAIQAGGYSIGSHSMTHANMPGLGYKEQVTELASAAQAIESVTKQPVALFRPPYGAFNEQTEKASRRNRSKIVLWNKDPEDWLTRDKDKIIQYVRNTEASGSIILLHESQAVVDALPSIIAYLKEQNLNIVSLR